MSFTLNVVSNPSPFESLIEWITTVHCNSFQFVGTQCSKIQKQGARDIAKANQCFLNFFKRRTEISKNCWFGLWGNRLIIQPLVNTKHICNYTIFPFVEQCDDSMLDNSFAFFVILFNKLCLVSAAESDCTMPCIK